jgi:hypothetical protein
MVYPAVRHGKVAIEGWTGRSWRRLATQAIRGGVYSIVLPGSGRFRVALGALDGPTLAVRDPRPTFVKLSSGASGVRDLLRGVLPSWVKVYAGAHAWPTARDRRPVRPVPLVLRAP